LKVVENDYRKMSDPQYIGEIQAHMIGKLVFDVDGRTCGYTGPPFYETMTDFHEQISRLNYYLRLITHYAYGSL
jgi:hypothetical protein